MIINDSNCRKVSVSFCMSRLPAVFFLRLCGGARKGKDSSNGVCHNPNTLRICWVFSSAAYGGRMGKNFNLRYRANLSQLIYFSIKQFYLHKVRDFWFSPIPLIQPMMLMTMMAQLRKTSQQEIINV